MLSAFKNFFITFLIAALVFGAAAYFATRFLTDTISGIFDMEANELDQILHQNSDTASPKAPLMSALNLMITARVQAKACSATA